jgi:TM2 domain-containing membrane protein YozV
VEEDVTVKPRPRRGWLLELIWSEMSSGWVIIYGGCVGKGTLLIDLVIPVLFLIPLLFEAIFLEPSCLE